MDLLDLQLKIMEMVREPANLPGIRGGHPAGWPGLAPYLGASEHDVAAALDLLVQRGFLRVRAWARDGRRRKEGWLDYDPQVDRIVHFLTDNFRLLATPAGMAWVDEERRRRAAAPETDTGNAAANDLVRKTAADALRGRSMTPEHRKCFEHVLARLAWIGVQNYSDRDFLATRSFRELKSLRARSRRPEFERLFYQPILHAFLALDPLVRRHLTKSSEMAGGACDLLLVGEIPVEAKVIYPEGAAEDPAAMGRGQVAQYAARSGLAFLAVLDMSKRAQATDAGQVANDIRIDEVQQKDGPNVVRVVRVQHVVGQGRPSRAKP